MSEAPIETVWLHARLDQWRGGDRNAGDEVLRAVVRRLEYLARRMLAGFPNVRSEADTGDVLQGAMLRFMNTLRNLQPSSTRDFVNLAAVHIRRELLDLARCSGVRRRARPAAAIGDSSADPLANAPAPPEDETELWTRFHEAVEQLPVEERETVSLTFYHGWKQTQIAEWLHVDERTVRRRWQSACLKLNQLVGGTLPNV